MSDEPTDYELTLRKLPLPYSLALRLRAAGVAPEQIGEYLGVAPDCLAGLYQMAEEKFDAARALLLDSEPP